MPETPKPNKFLSKKFLIPIIIAVAVILGVTGTVYYFFNRGSSDTIPPEISLTSPTSEEWYSTDKDKISIEGLAGDENGIKSIAWSTDKDKNGSATISDNDTWKVEDIPLSAGDNKITVKAEDKSGNSSEVVLNVVYNSDVVFYDINLSQDYIYKDDPAARITIRAGIETKSTSGVKDVNLYKISGDNKEKLTTMLDNGMVINGDDIPGDSVYSGIESFSSSTTEPILLRVGTATEGSDSVSYSGVIKITVLNKLSSEQISKMLSLNEEINNKFDELKRSKDPKEAAKELAKFVSDKEEIAAAGTSDDGYGVWWEFKDTGILGGVENNPEGTKGNLDTKQLESRKKAENTTQKERAEQEKVKGLFTDFSSPAMFGPSAVYAEESEGPKVKSTKALYLGPYLSAFGQGDDYYGAWQVIKKSKCPECQTVEKKNNEVKVDDFKTLSQYGLVVVSSHGDTWFDGQFAANCGDKCPEGLKNRKGQVVTLTSQGVNQYSLFTYLPDLLMQRLAITPSNKLAVLPSYIKRYNGTFPSSLVYISACRSFHNFSLAIAFLSKGAKAFYGYDEYVYVSYAKKAGEAMMKSFIDQNKTAYESFKNAIATAGTNDGGQPPAYFKYWGWSTLKMGGEDVQNTGFEEGLLGWQTGGDARVLTSLASLKPQEGDKMATISTGLGSVSDSNSFLIQKICAREGTLSVSFKYDVVSEEPMEYVGSSYDDSFTAIVTTKGKYTTLAHRTINNSSWKKIGGINFAGGDNTTYHTGWKPVSKNLGKVSADDSIQIEFRVRDKGDSIYDTAALIDAVKVEIK